MRRMEQWTQEANCRGQDPELFLSPKPEMQRYVKNRFCTDCKVKEECLDYAMARSREPSVQGVWGGMTAQERKDLRAKGERRSA